MVADTLTSAMPPRVARDDGALLPGVMLGIGLGGFFDGIVLHQLLQWHHMVSTPYPATTLDNLRLNTLWDGIFHGATWIAVVAGLVVLWRRLQAGALRARGRALAGAML